MLLDNGVCIVEKHHHVGSVDGGGGGAPSNKEQDEKLGDGRAYEHGFHEIHPNQLKERQVLKRGRSMIGKERHVSYHCDAVLQHHALAGGKQLDEGRQDACLVCLALHVCEGVVNRRDV